MKNSNDIPVLERPAFFDGQRLLAADLAAVQAFHRELRWLHNRSLHNWGIAFGYAVSGARGERLVRVRPGYALDCEGHELILSAIRDMPIPAVSSETTYYLTVAYAEDADLPAEMRTGVCGMAGSVRRSEMPLLRWQDPHGSDPSSRYRQGLDVILATIKVKNCQLDTDVSGAERRDAVPAQQPYIAAGQTEPGRTVWKPWPEDAPIGLSTTVITTSAAFRATPRYQAHVVGTRFFNGVFEGLQLRFIIDGYAQAAAASRSSFELGVLLPVGTIAEPSRTYTVTAHDYALVKMALIQRHTFGPTPPTIALPNLSSISVNQLFHIVEPGGNIIPGTVMPIDFTMALADIAARNNITVDRLRSIIGVSDTRLSLSIGDRLVIPGEVLALNPPEVVLKPSFMDFLRTHLQWHVVWMGVEG